MEPTEFRRRVEALFERCLDEPGREDVCLADGDDDPEVLAEVRSLLEHRAPPNDDPRAGEVEASPVGRVVGSFTITGVLGHGGSATVYRAVRRDPRQEVALKVLRPWAEGPRDRRLRVETEALVRLDHPGIVKFLEAGVSRDGEPWFASELVRGVPIHEHAERNRLSVGERVRLVADLCDAIAHAHRRGVLHRDLKPSNVMVEERDPDGRGDRWQVRVLDFGVARVADSSVTLSSQLGRGGIVGSIPYMSPEQANGQADVGPPADVFALGALLFELLAGRPPIELPRGSFAVALVARLKADEEGAYPRLRDVKPDAGPDLDVIVSTALAVELEQRYATVDALREDLQDWLADRPLRHARVTPRLERARKFLRRHRRAAAGTAIGTVAVLALGAAWLIERARSADALEREVTRSRGVLSVVQGVLSREDVLAKGRDVRVVDLLGPLGEHAGTLAEDPEGQATLRRLLGSFHQVIGDLERAETLLREAWTVHRERLGDGHPDAVASAHALAQLLHARGRHAEAERLFRLVVAARVADLGPGHVDTLAARNDLAVLWVDEGELALAITTLREVVDGFAETVGADAPRTWNARSNLADALLRADSTKEGLALLEQVAGGFERRLGAGHPETLFARAMLAAGRWRAGELDVKDAERELRQQVEVQRALFGEDHPATSTSINNLAHVLERAGKVDEAESLHRAVLARRSERLGEEHPKTWISRQNLAALLFARKRLDEAEEVLASVPERAAALLGPDHPDTLLFTSQWGEILRASGRGAEAVLALESAVATWPPSSRGSSVRALGRMKILKTLALAAGDLGRADERVRWFRARAELAESAFGAAHVEPLLARCDLGASLTHAGRHDEAVALLADGVARAEASGFDADLVANLRYLYAIALGAAGRLDEAITELERARTSLAGVEVRQVRLPGWIDRKLTEYRRLRAPAAASSSSGDG